MIPKRLPLQLWPAILLGGFLAFLTAMHPLLSLGIVAITVITVAMLHRANVKTFGRDYRSTVPRVRREFFGKILVVNVRSTTKNADGSTTHTLAHESRWQTWKENWEMNKVLLVSLTLFLLVTAGLIIWWGTP